MTHIFETIASRTGETPEQIRSQIEEAVRASDLPAFPPELFISVLARIVVGEGDEGNPSPPLDLWKTLTSLPQLHSPPFPD